MASHSIMGHFQGFVLKHGVDKSPCPHMFRRPCTRYAIGINNDMRMLVNLPLEANAVLRGLFCFDILSKDFKNSITVTESLYLCS